MKEHPILFSAPMVRALLDGSKTQTRRVLKNPFTSQEWSIRPADRRNFPGHTHDWWLPDATMPASSIRCPYGEPGDRLWVKETFSIGEDLGTGWEPGMSDGDFFVIYDAGGSEDYCVPDDYCPPRNAKEVHNCEGTDEHWRRFGSIPSIFMPRWASRMTLEVTEVRVERLQEISGMDAAAEGAPKHACYGPECPDGPEGCNARGCFGAREWYAELWDKINGAGSWDANPWVWAITFKRVQP